MPGLIRSHHVTRLLCPRSLALGLAAMVVLSAAAIATSRRDRLPHTVVVDHVPPDACVAYYGPGPCREHGHTVIGSTDAVALWPPLDEVRPRMRAQSEEIR